MTLTSYFILLLLFHETCEHHQDTALRHRKKPSPPVSSLLFLFKTNSFTSHRSSLAEHLSAHKTHVTSYAILHSTLYFAIQAQPKCYTFVCYLSQGISFRSVWQRFALLVLEQQLWPAGNAFHVGRARNPRRIEEIGRVCFLYHNHHKRAQQWWCYFTGQERVNPWL